MDDITHVDTHHEDALVIIVKVDGCNIKRIQVDGERSTYIVFLDAFERIVQSRKYCNKVYLEMIWRIYLLVVLGEGWKSMKVDVFLIEINVFASHNSILDQITIKPKNITATTVH